jgi:hypothetical protein
MREPKSSVFSLLAEMLQSGARKTVPERADTGMRRRLLCRLMAMFFVVAVVTVENPFIRMAQAQPQATDALRLVRAMEVDKSVLLGMQMTIENAFPAGKVSQAQLDCVHGVQSTVFTAPIAQTLEKALTAEEIATAMTFFESVTGKKYSQLGLVHLYHAFGRPAPVPTPPFSEAEQAIVRRFADTSGGDKLTRRKLIDSPEVKQAYGAKIGEILNACKR